MPRGGSAVRCRGHPRTCGVRGAGHSAIVASDGGITLWISYDNLDTAGASLADTITEANVLPGGFSCTPTNDGRTAVGAANSPASCPGGTGSCTGEEKISGDIESLADYIFQSTEGTHYLRRVYISDEGRAWDSSDIKWNTGIGGSSAPFGWANPGSNMNLQSAYRTCIHDVTHHELGHYMYNLPDRYARADGYYRGTVPGSATVIDVDIVGRDINTVMSNNFPHLFVDTTNATITVDYNQPGPGTTTGEVLTPPLLSDADATNDGPDRAHHNHTTPFAQDEWSLLPSRHADLTGIHTEGTFAAAGARPAVDIVIVGDDEPHPGTALLLDRSGSMGVTTNGISAAQFVQEAGMFLYHSAETGDFVGTFLYNATVEELFPYDVYDATNDLPFASFRTASGLTNIASALESAIDALIAEHGADGANGGEIYLMSDGRQTTGASLWDQVTRANGLGIKIHTFSFGNADTTTMNDIATGSSGSTTPMSERDDAAELKMLMTRKFSTGRGMTPIHVFKGAMRERINLGSTQIFPGQFNVPPKTRDLQFYTFLHLGDASQSLTLQLQAPDGTVFSSPPPDNVAIKGRFNGVKVDKPEPGTWTFFISGVPGSGLPSEDIEIAAYADNRELKGNVWIEDITANGVVQLHAQLQFRYPLTEMAVNAAIYASGDRVAVVPMFDDGTSGGDYRGEDGIYSTQINLGDAQLKKLLANIERRPNKLRVEVDFNVSTNSRPAPFAHYETGFTRQMLETDYARGNRADFKAWATGVINLADVDPNRQPKDPRFGGDFTKDPIRTTRGKSGTLRFTMLNARPLASQLRVSLGQGVTAKVSSVQCSNGEDAKTDDDKSQDDTPQLRLKEAVKRDLSTEAVRQLQRVPLPTQRVLKPLPALQAVPVKPVQCDVIVKYKVSRKAKPGPRDLHVQYGDVVLEQKDVIIVGK